jgi:hypothetical protein
MSCAGSTAYYTDDGGVTWTKSDANFHFTLFAAWDKPRTEVDGNLTDCCMASKTEAWACCEQGGVFRSTDGGKTWKFFTAFDDYRKTNPLYTIDMKSGGSGWCTGSQNKLFNTVTIRRFANNKWSSDPVTAFGASDCIYDISCLTGDDGWLVGKGGLILHLQGTKFGPVKPYGQPKS